MKHTCQPQTTYNIECVLFDLCNLHCTFCYESTGCGKRVNKFNKDYIKELPEIFKQYHIPRIKKDNKKDINLSLYGGELFLDSFPDDLFEDYEEFIFKIYRCLKREVPDARLSVFWLSNYTFTKWERVKQLLDATNTNIATSYDPVGRFHSPDLLGKWLMTFNHFKDRTIMTTVSLHTKNIEAIINGDRGFEILMNTPQVLADASYYTPIYNGFSASINDAFDKFIPSDSDIFDFYKFIVDNRYFSVNIVPEFMKTALDLGPVNSYCHCDAIESYFHYNPVSLPEGTTYLDEDLGGTCLDSVEAFMENENDKKSYYGDNYDIMKNNKNKYAACYIRRGCMNCEWCQNCQRMCFSAIMYKNFKPEVCPLDRIYRYIQKDTQIVEDYLKYKPKYNEVRYVR